MASLLAQVPLVGRLVAAPAPQTIDLPSVTVHDIETNRDRRARCLKHLLKANHVNHSIIYHHLQFDNHTAHILCSAYLLGATENQLHAIYEAEDGELEPWHESPSEIVEEDWRDFLGDRRYQRAYVDFFEDTLALKFAYDWKETVGFFMFEGKEPLVHGLIGGLGHPLIHLGYAFEMNSKEIGMEALGMAATQYNFLHKYSDDRSYTRPASPEVRSSSVFKLLDRLASDKRFDGLFKEPGFDNIDPLFEKHEDLVLEYWNAWEIHSATSQFSESQEAAVALLVATVAPGTHAYNFFIVHLLTTSHAIRILLPFVPAKFHVALVREWWMLVLAVYIAQLRPRIDPDYAPPDKQLRQWNFVEDKAVNSPWAKDAHYVKAIRAMKEAAMTWGDMHERYLSAAIIFVENFRGWTH